MASVWHRFIRRFSITFGVILLVAVFQSPPPGIPSNPRIAFIGPVDRPAELPEEERAAWNWLVNRYGKDVAYLPLRSIQRLADVKPFDLVWWHSTVPLEQVRSQMHSNAKSALRRYIDTGGRMILSLMAVPFVVDFGLESNPPDTVFTGQRIWGWRPIFGFQAYGPHPLLKPFHGGLYTWYAEDHRPYWFVAYTGQNWPHRGRVVAVGKGYIEIHAEDKLIIEYESRTGRVIAIGAYLYFSHERNDQRPHLEAWMHHVIQTMLTPQDRLQPAVYWQPLASDAYVVELPPPPPEPPHLRLSPRGEKSIVPHPDFSAMRLTGPGDRWPWDLAGRRILVTGRRTGRIDEVWVYPYRTLRNIRIAILFPTRGKTVWLDGLPGQTIRVETTPDHVEFRYQLKSEDGDITVRNLIFAALTAPLAGIITHIETPVPLQIVYRFAGDARLMWPRTRYETGKRFLSWDPDTNAVVFHCETNRLWTYVGTSPAPVHYVLGDFDPTRDVGSNGLITRIESGRVGTPTAALAIDVEKGTSRVVLVMASAEQRNEARRLFERGRIEPERFHIEVAQYYRKFLEETLDIESPDPVFNQGFRWAKVGVDKFLVTTPGMGTMYVAGYSRSGRGWAEARPGYAWYFGRDAEWVGMAALHYGAWDQVRKTLEFLGRYQDITGKIFHEMTPSWTIHYDAADSTPLYIVLMGRYLRHTADTAFIQREWPKIRKAMDFLFATDRDGDGLIENTRVGHGWVEGGKLCCSHTTLYLAGLWAAALDAASDLARVVGDTARARQYATAAVHVRATVAERFYNPETDFYNHGILADGSARTEKTILPAVPMLFELIPPERSETMLRAWSSESFTSDWGCRIVAKESPLYNPTGYHEGSVWPLFTGWVSLAEYTYHRPLQGFIHMMNNLQVYRHFNVGYVEEVLHGEVYQPSGVCSHQAWSESMVVQPAIEGMLGVRLNALKRQARLRPHIPDHWNALRVRNLRVGVTRLDWTVQRNARGTVHRFRLQAGPPIRIRFEPALPHHVPVGGVRINGRAVDVQIQSTERDQHVLLDFDLRGEAIVQILHPPIPTLIPPIAEPIPHEPSRGIRIIEERRHAMGIEYLVQGRAGVAYELELVSIPEGTRVEGATVVQRGKDGRLTLRVRFPEGRGYTFHRFQLFFPLHRGGIRRPNRAVRSAAEPASQA